MLILGMDTSGKYAACGVWENGRLMGETSVFTRRAHSQVILPMAKRLLTECGKEIAGVDGYAVVTGPGSYTGLRIGIGAVKGLCMGSGKGCYGVSALEAIAANFCGVTVCAVMHARQDLYYGAFFEVSFSGEIKRLCADRIIPLTELAKEARERAADSGQVIICSGEGCEEVAEAAGENVYTPPEEMRRPSVGGICRIAAERGFYEPEKLQAEYMQVTKAEKDLENW
ncbi:MAG: tRNA (adenosine(37)-N6)-threonylcarbamoyltransferase complex dimerization subunit type 1 TsaB [Ruminococcus sp.]|nr:tRNA (adenosine(37)-N6)-threonylcarbamoyltransferase complex dimerization subunit type 1 TsaB [Ruminococcus sp.]